MGQYDYMPKKAILENIIIDFDLEEKNFLTRKCGKWKLEKKGKKERAKERIKKRKSKEKNKEKNQWSSANILFMAFFHYYHLSMAKIVLNLIHIVEVTGSFASIESVIIVKFP